MGWAHCWGCGNNALAGQACTCAEPKDWSMTRDPQADKLMDKFMAEGRKDRTSTPIEQEQSVYVVTLWIKEHYWEMVSIVYAGTDKAEAVKEAKGTLALRKINNRTQQCRTMIEEWRHGSVIKDEWIILDD